MARLWKRMQCLWYGHDPMMVKHLNILAHIRCNHCGGEWCYNQDYGIAIRWSPAAEEFFARRLGGIR